MPKPYEAVRDACIQRKRKNKKDLSEKDIQECKKSAAIWYYKKYGKPVRHSDGVEDKTLSDAVELDILIEQLDLFGSLDNYNDWSKK